MKAFFQRLFGQKEEKKQKTPQGPPPEPEILYDWKDISVQELNQFPNGLQEVFERKFDGFIIRNVLNQQEVDEILKHFHNLPDSETLKINPGLTTYPAAFSQVDQRSENRVELLKTYFANCVRFVEDFPNNFGVNFAQKVQNALTKLAGGRAVSPPPGIDESGIYTPFNFRQLHPGPGELKAHCGNFFHKEFPQFFSHLDETSSVKDQLSYFVMLQTAEKGGELCLYDIEWDAAEKRLHGDTKLETKTGKIKDLENPWETRRQFIEPQPGDMIVFAGGQIWHKVNYVQGSRDRITLGGFLSFTRDNKEVYFWT